MNHARDDATGAADTALLTEIQAVLRADVAAPSPPPSSPPPPPSATRPPDALSDRCSICHATPKYRCPRCRARTCSLPCATIHKARALCSGARDPAARVSRAALATPAAFDRDYNFLTGVEKARERWRREREARGAEGRGRKGPAKGEVRLEAALARAGCTVRRAPEGLRRRKENRTEWRARTKCIRWTIEWIVVAGATPHPARGAMAEPEALRAGFAACLQQLRGDDRRRCALGAALRTAPKSLRAGLAALGFDSTFAEGAGDAAAANKGHATKGDDLSGWCHFYLHAPAQSAGTTVRVLPVAGEAPLREALRGETVVEFPTVYVLGVPPERLQEGGLELGDGRRLECQDGGRRREIKKRLAELERAKGETAGKTDGGGGGKA